LLNTNGTISVITLTSPTISGIQNDGGNLILSGSGGPSGWPYIVLSTTELNSSWVPVATNYFDALGNFSSTNAFNPNQSQLFYKLQLQ
jgi:hypothetical protein